MFIFQVNDVIKIIKCKQEWIIIVDLFIALSVSLNFLFSSTSFFFNHNCIFIIVWLLLTNFEYIYIVRVRDLNYESWICSDIQKES